MPSQTAYLAHQGTTDELARELGALSARYDRLLVALGPAREASWAANVWHEPQTIHFDSIAQGATALRDIQRNWACYSFRHHRRAALLQEKLPHVSAKPLVFPEPAPAAPLGSWTLLDENTLFAAARCSSPFPNGEVRFIEDRHLPPNRAYLKLWEAFTLADVHPGPGDVCVDLGSSPGGWTWVLAELGARVISVDKAPLDPTVAAHSAVDFRQMSAFAIEPASLGPIDWMVCDIACYPERLWKLVERWLAWGGCRHFVCTIKLQGETDTSAVARFASLPGSRVRHLTHNKHELTWIKL